MNYGAERAVLEATYKTNDADIYAVAVNEGFCAIGSADQYIRVWALDFSEFYMEAKHEGTVCSLDMSPDGLRVVCGTMNGTLGILDQSNQNYRTLMRSHTDKIISMAFHRGRSNLITVSENKVMAIWDIHDFSEKFEFTSPQEKPLCVTAHPDLPVFATGFDSGFMRVFDIEKTCEITGFK